MTKLLLSTFRSEYEKNNNNEHTIKMDIIIRIHKPLDGSEAKECTEVNTPDLTKKVPKRLNEKLRIAYKRVQV